MLKDSIIIKYLAGLINLVLQAVIGIALFLFTTLFSTTTEIFEIEDRHTYYVFIFFSVVISASYAFLFFVCLYRMKIRKLYKAFVNGLFSTLMIYIFSHVGGGGLSFDSSSSLMVLLIIFILGFMLPFSLHKVYEILKSRMGLILVIALFCQPNNVGAQTKCLTDTTIKTHSVGNKKESLPFAAKFLISKDSIVLVDNLNANDHLIFKVLKKTCNWDDDYLQGESVYVVVLSSTNKKAILKIVFNSDIQAIYLYYENTDEPRVFRISNGKKTVN